MNFLRFWILLRSIPPGSLIISFNCFIICTESYFSIERPKSDLFVPLSLRLSLSSLRRLFAIAERHLRQVIRPSLELPECQDCSV